MTETIEIKVGKMPWKHNLTGFIYFGVYGTNEDRKTIQGMSAQEFRDNLRRYCNNSKIKLTKMKNGEIKGYNGKREIALALDDSDYKELIN